MIKADPGHSAWYEAAKKGEKSSIKKVVAWDDDGNPMVVGRKDHSTVGLTHKQLVRADSLPGYEGIYLDPDPLPLAFIPGNGWMAERPNGSRDPLVAWAMCTYGGVADVFAMPVFTEEMEVFRGDGATWTSARMGGDPDPVRVVPEKPGDRA